MANDKQLYPKLIKDVEQLKNVAPGVFCFFGESYKSLILFSPDTSDIPIPTAHEIVEQITQILKKYPPVACLYIFEEMYRRHNLDLTVAQIADLRSAYLDILRSYSSEPHVKNLVAYSKLMRDEKQQFISEYAAFIADDALVNNPKAIAELIQTGGPEFHRAIRKHGLIDTIKYRWWKRNELYAALEEVEKLSPSEFIFHRYFDALDLSHAGYYARQRLARYKAEIDQLPVEFKFEFILKNPSRAVGFFSDERFINELTNRRPDLFFKLISLKELTTSDIFKGELFLSPDGFAGNLVDAAVRVGNFEEIKFLESQIEGLGWTSIRYPALRENIQQAKEKAEKEARKEEKGKQEAAGVAVTSGPNLAIVKVELSDITQLDRVLKENQHCKKLEVYSPCAIFVVDFSRQQEKLAKKHAGIKTPVTIYRAALEQTIYLPPVFSIGACEVSTIGISSEQFQEAYKAKGSPDEINFKPVKLGVLARVGQWLSNVFGRTKKSNNERKVSENPAIQITHPIRISALRSASSAVKMMHVFSGSESSMMEEISGDTESSDESLKIYSPSSKSRMLYKEALQAFYKGDYHTAVKKICALMESVQGKYNKETEDQLNTTVNDEAGLRTELLVRILQEVNADFLDYLMVDELMQQELSDDALGAMSRMREAVAHLFGGFTIDRFGFPSVPEKWRGPVQLFVLERQFLNLDVKSTTYKSKALKLQREYMDIVKEYETMPLARAMASKSKLVSFCASTDEIAKSRVTVMNMFERDPSKLVEQMFDVISQNKIAEPSGFISNVVAKVGIEAIVLYACDVYPNGLEILLKNSSWFLWLLRKNKVELTELIRGVPPQCRQILRKYLPSEFNNAKNALNESFNLDVENVLNGEYSAKQKFSDPFFIDEIEANPAQKIRIIERDDIYAVYKNYAPNYTGGIQQMFDKYTRNENLPEDLILKVIEQAGMPQVIQCITTLSPQGLRILLARKLLPEKESYLQALASSDFPEVRQTLRGSGFILSDKVKEILARKMRKNVEALTDHDNPDQEKARAKLNDKFFVAELFFPENVEQLKKFETTFPGLLQEVVSAQMYSLRESIAQAQVRASSIPKPF